MALFDSLRSRLRLILGGHEARRVPKRTSKPRIGAHVVNVEQELSLVVQAGMTDELWLWLMEHGWRVENYRPDRRAYLQIPVTYVTRLTDAEPSRWDELLTEAILNAQPRDALVRKKV